MQTDLSRSLIDALPVPAMLVSGAARIVVVNAGARALLGLAAEGRHYVMSLRQPSVTGAIEAALLRGEVGTGRYVVTGPGSETVFKVSVRPVAGEGQVGALCVFEDVTDAEQMGQMRRDFVANVSHELRTPLTALLGFIETLRGAARDDPAARERFLGIMEREAGRMNRLVSDLLHLSRVEASERMRPSDMVDVWALVAMTVTAVKPLVDGVRIDMVGDPGPLYVPGDADQLTQVFHNLIENAVKYGGKAVTIRLTRGDACVMIAVQDQGDGIDPVHLPRLTERFYRVDSHRSRAQGGTGLGLAIVKHIMNRHRGKLRIESDLGRGSTFTVILPES
jgi:two-component system, OmpR family, phosphate regulon sensor histidine kinase PhoR